jgi:hypothetical protein
MGQANAWAQGLGGIGQTATGLAGMYTGYQTGQQQLQALQNLGLGMGGLGGFAGAVQTPLNNPNVYLGSFAPGTYAPYAIS